MIWITGGKGMLGRHVAEKAAAEGLPFAATDLDLDIADAGAVAAFARDKAPRWIINCASYTQVDRAEDERDAAFAANAEGIGNLGEAAVATGARIVHLSTDYVFPGEKPDGYAEEDGTGPLSVYGASKLEGEERLRATCAGHFIFRISWLYGPHGRNFVHTMLGLFMERDEVSVVDDQFGSPTYTGELAEFIVGLVRSSSERFGTYHFSGEGMTSWHGFAVEINRLARQHGIIGREVKIIPVDSSAYPAKAKRPAFSYLRKDKIGEVFGFRPRDWRMTLEGYIREMASLSGRGPGKG